MDELVEACAACGSTDTSCVSCDEWGCSECGGVFYVDYCDCFDDTHDGEP
jgi:protein-arginine kinase activator protein McsA